jgi:hypothetical protein
MVACAAALAGLAAAGRRLVGPGALDGGAPTSAATGGQAVLPTLDAFASPPTAQGGGGTGASNDEPLVFSPDGADTPPDIDPGWPDEPHALLACRAAVAFYSFDADSGPVTWRDRVDAARPYLSAPVAEMLQSADPTGQVTARSTAIWPEIAASADARCWPGVLGATHVDNPAGTGSGAPTWDDAWRVSLTIRVDVAGLRGERWIEVHQLADLATARVDNAGRPSPDGDWRIVAWTGRLVTEGFEWAVAAGVGSRDRPIDPAGTDSTALRG